MSGYICDAYRNKCRLPDDFTGFCDQRTLPDWQWMVGAMPDGIMPTDADGIIERRGHFLLLDGKRSLQDTVGQKRAHAALSMKPDWTVLYLGPVCIMDVEAVESLRMGFVKGVNIKWSDYVAIETVRDWLRDWCARMDANPFVS